VLVTSTKGAEPTADPGLRVLLTGATGFVGRHVHPRLVRRGFEVYCATRRPEAARAQHPHRRWRRLDLDDPGTFDAALEGCHAALYLVHQMSGTGDYLAREVEGARRFAQAAARNGLQRIVYLGGVAPDGEPSTHLASRLATGRTLREGPVPTIELRAAMIMGPGSESWRIVRDLSARLPAMVLPSWLSSRSQPIDIDDVCFALEASLRLPQTGSACFDLPGPEVLSAEEILVRVARLRGVDPFILRVPFVSPSLSSYWIQLVTRADIGLARELVRGLQHDLVARDASFWARFPEHRRVPFDESAQRAFDAETETLSLGARTAEVLINGLSRRVRGWRP
jgi:uncharacterized protein YbjT (DUF2867 family)